MIRKIKSSLTAKVFLLTAALLLGVSLLVFGLLAWLMPQTYSNRLNTALKEQAQDFIAELEQVPFSGSGGLFDQFLQNREVDSVELYNSHGAQIPLPSEEFTSDGNEAAVVEQNSAETAGQAPILSAHYYFSFSGSNDRYMLIVYGTAESVALLRQSFGQVFPWIAVGILIVSLAVSWIYSRLVTRPVLDLSRISEQMSALHFNWQVSEQRTDELGILAKSLNTLSRSLSATLSDLQQANAKLLQDMEQEKRLARARTSFFSAVSHELKTPVTIIKGQLEGMLLGIGVYKDRETYLARSLAVTNTLEAMVQEILTVSRLETAGDNLKKEEFDCIPMIKSYLNETEDWIVGKELQLALTLPPAAFLHGNRMLMEKVFSNLIGNAIAYSPHGASIEISVTQNHGRLAFSVENTGAHIPEEHMSRLFDAFYRLEQSRNRETGGTGLGLYIVQEVLRRHGSECQVCNTPAGVRFSFVL